MVSLLSKSQDNILVQMVLYSDDDSIRQAFSNGFERLCGRFEEILPRIEDEGIVDSVRLGKEDAGIIAGFCDRDDFALIRLIERVGCIVLWMCTVLVRSLRGTK